MPADCPAGMVDAPLLPDAADVLRQPGVVTYTTLTSLAEAAAFYQEQLPALGWAPLPDPVMAESSALLEFTRADQQLSVILVADESATTVSLVLGAVQP